MAKKKRPAPFVLDHSSDSGDWIRTRWDDTVDIRNLAAIHVMDGLTPQLVIAMPIYRHNPDKDLEVLAEMERIRKEQQER